MQDASFVIEQPSKTDMKSLKLWLKNELITSQKEELVSLKEAWGDEMPKDYKPSGSGFFHNWNVIQDAAKAKRMWVCRHSDSVVGFLCWDERGSPEIMEVRSELRGRGIGKKLVDLYLSTALKDGVDVMEIDCAPSESLGFWEKMGFVKMESRNRVRARLVLPDLHPHHVDPSLPDRGSASFFFKEEGSSRNVIAQSKFTADLSRSKFITLAQKMIAPSKSDIVQDLFLEIEVNGCVVFCDKAKRDECEEMGVCRAESSHSYFSLKHLDVSCIEIAPSHHRPTIRRPLL